MSSVLHAANVHEFVLGLPQGYDTAMGENGSLLSGGQAQRVQIVRVFSRPSTVLVLDECTLRWMERIRLLCWRHCSMPRLVGRR